ncbi:hypothetical protein M9Y90_19390 [Leptospira interrogans]|uniref:Uncharacterized protein n=3 Tax=Leptospira interrogans TaxID=173 RepID=A0AAP9W939_LEPIR|nr:hypothetical protein [Leptospira interrogans]EMN72236.1 hypothetical protein LEP1GSC100_1979 [Leptospira interrogans serovar Bataviae str. UI 08561]KAA1289922.1 hypothetical protein C4X99_05275 [Leptospira interrogans serovar Geyaweera]EKO25843.1 hypothetical protein LEP1GSC104_4944 [Leptospira interrogans str. UI 12621]MBE0305358.1 hypothetical protein [Leptospira interrogans serovar Yeoncheon]MCL8312801.1 hypothetical protein [Leptospira interrogans]
MKNLKKVQIYKRNIYDTKSNIHNLLNLLNMKNSSIKAVTLFLDSLLSKKKMIGMLQELQIK